jgi:hypothetical protein
VLHFFAFGQLVALHQLSACAHSRLDVAVHRERLLFLRHKLDFARVGARLVQWGGFIATVAAVADTCIVREKHQYQ